MFAPIEVDTRAASMKLEQLVKSNARIARATDAALILGTRQVLRDCERGGWLVPCLRRKKKTLFALSDLHRCADRIIAGEYPTGGTPCWREQSALQSD